MEFDITLMDKRMLLQTLFAHAAPVNFGHLEYNFRKSMGENVIGLTPEECDHILYQFNNSQDTFVRVLDYHKGKPMKLYFEKKRNGRILVASDGYDSRNGKYRFLEALLNVFMLDEILITKKGFKQYVLNDLPEYLIRSKEMEHMFRDIVKSTISSEYEFGNYWAINESEVSYVPPFMR